MPDIVIGNKSFSENLLINLVKAYNSPKTIVRDKDGKPKGIE